jgi:nucleoside-diphosphate kinase
MEKTFAIIKPDAVGNGHIGKVLSRIEDEGFRTVAMRMLHLTRGEAEGFYAVHRERPFFDSLTAYMSSGPVVALVLERDDAIPHWRKTMGATDPGKAEPGTIRKQIGESIERNAVHGSDAPETAAIEIAYFFRGVDQLSAR